MNSPPSPALLSLFLLLAAVLGALLFSIFRRRPADSGAGQALLQLQQQVTDLVRALQETAHRITGETGSQLQAGTKALTDLVQSSQTHLITQVSTQSQAVGEKVGALQERLAKLDEEIRHLAEMGQDLRRLQDILRAPKVRGGFGEQLLESLLGNVLPGSDYQLQHRFSGGEQVDAVIRLPGGLVPVDAKFPLENFQKLLSAEGEEDSRRARKAFRDDVRKHGRAIAAKYIRPEEGTLDLALMYVPAENVYYEAFVHSEGGGAGEELWDEALALRVFPLSPNTFSLYLSTLRLGLRGMRVEEGARRIVAALASLHGELGAFRESFELASRHLVNAGRNLEDARRKLEALEWKFHQAEALGAGEPGTSEPAPPGGPAGG